MADRDPPVRLGRVLFRDDELLCTDCKLVGGDSGGPLFNMRGEVVGIHSSIGPMITHNFHVPITAFRRDWQRLLASDLWGGRYDRRNQRRAMLGVSGTTTGGKCVITEVAEDMPAAKAGVRVGDVDPGNRQPRDQLLPGTFRSRGGPPARRPHHAPFAAEYRNHRARRRAGPARRNHPPAEPTAVRR